MKQPLISIIIANFNGKKYLHLCLSSILQSTYQHFEILIIDDGSTDTSKSILSAFQKKDPRIRLYENEQNKGAAASRNSMVQKAKGDILIFLDNDTQVDGQWLTKLLQTIDRDASIGGAQSLLVDYQDRKKIQTAGTKVWAMNATGLPLLQGQDPKTCTKETPIIALSAALAIKKHVFEVVGGFDEEESVVTEDLDFSWRVWIAGYQIILSPHSWVYHWTKTIDMRKHMHHSKETIYFHLTKNSLMSIMKNYQFTNMIKYLITSISIALGRSILVMVKRKDNSALKGTTKGMLWVISHIPHILIKRRKVQKTRKYTDDTLFAHVILRLSLKDIYQQYFRQTGLL